VTPNDPLLLDLGNTRLKWWRPALEAPVENSSTNQTQRALTHSDAPSCWEALFAHSAKPPSAIWLASVAGARSTALLLRLANTWPCPVHLVKSPARFGRWQSSYAQPARLGVDRFLGMLAALEAQSSGAKNTAQSVLVVMVGTAMTLDVVDASGLHVGGLIVPGPSMMRSSLHRGTAELPDVDGAASTEHALGTASEPAIALGSVRACASLIDAVASDYPQAQVLLSGGAAPAVQPWLRFAPTAISCPDLVLRGLARYAQGE
jgi:type III pantothenate kinase